MEKTKKGFLRKKQLQIKLLDNGKKSFVTYFSSEFEIRLFSVNIYIYNTISQRSRESEILNKVKGCSCLDSIIILEIIMFL